MWWNFYLLEDYELWLGFLWLMFFQCRIVVVFARSEQLDSHRAEMVLSIGLISSSPWSFLTFVNIKIPVIVVISQNYARFLLLDLNTGLEVWVFRQTRKVAWYGVSVFLLFLQSPIYLNMLVALLILPSFFRSIIAVSILSSILLATLALLYQLNTIHLPFLLFMRDWILFWRLILYQTNGFVVVEILLFLIFRGVLKLLGFVVVLMAIFFL